MGNPDQDQAVAALRAAIADLPLDEHQRHIFRWLEMWEPSTINAITAVIHYAAGENLPLF